MFCTFDARGTDNCLYVWGGHEHFYHHCAFVISWLSALDLHCCMCVDLHDPPFSGRLEFTACNTNYVTISLSPCETNVTSPQLCVTLTGTSMQWRHESLEIMLYARYLSKCRTTPPPPFPFHPHGCERRPPDQTGESNNINSFYYNC